MTSPPSPDKFRHHSVYVPFQCEIVSIIDLTPNEKLFTLCLPGEMPLRYLPGQFLQVSIMGCGEAPISVASSPTRGPQFQMGVRRVGTVTGAMHGMKKGDVIGIRGPYGRSFELERMHGKDLLLISGGCGLAPMRSLIQYCQDRPEEFGRVSLMYGAKTPADIMFKTDFEEWERVAGFACSRIVDRAIGPECFNGSTGLITDLVRHAEIDPFRTIGVIIGPPVMYRPVISILKEKGLTSDRIVVSLERQMRCGIGKCGHCIIEHLYCCQDGPVFWLDQVEKLPGAL